MALIYEIFNRKNGNVRHNWKEKCGFKINRPKGMPCYTFWHFQTPVELLTAEGTVKAESGACYLCTPSVRQHFESEGVLIHDWMHLDEEAAQIWRACGLQTDTLYYPAEPSFITGLIRHVEEEYIAKAEHSEKMLYALLWQLFIRIDRGRKPDNTVPDGGCYSQLRDLRRRVMRDLQEPWTVEKMAQQVNMSQSMFYAMYRKFFRCSPVQDLLNERIAAAKNQLQYSDRPVAQIAESLGYHDPTHFSRQFRSYTGLSPTAYRKING